MEKIFTAKDIEKSFDRNLFFDHSADSADPLNKRTVDYANSLGGKIELPADGEDYSEMLSYAGDEAIEYLNTLCDDSVSFEFDENSLFLVRNEE